MFLTDVVVGLQHGDEGKGKVTYNLLQQEKYSYSIRYNGGPNAGHTIKVKDKNLTIVLHQIPCGVLHDTISFIGGGCVVDLEKLEEEICYLEQRGYHNVRKLLYIAYNAHIIEPQHITTDNCNDTIGTTKSGIGPCYSDKYNRTSKRVYDYGKRLLKMQIRQIDLLTYFTTLPNSVKYKILCEGAQGFSLDIDWGDYPYCTSSSCLSSGITSAGIPINSIRHVYGCCKIYDTYVGNKQFQPENNTQLETLANYGKEYGSTTGRKRQCNWLNIETLKMAIFINSCTHVIVNKCDIIQDTKIYVMDNITFDSFEVMQKYFEHCIDPEKYLHIIYSYNPYTI